MTAPTELLPCPHCGSATAPKLKPWDGDPPMPGFYVVCDAAGWEGMEGRGCGCSGAYGEDEGEAVAAWNRRVPASGAGWRPISEAPKDGTNVLYRNQFRDIGFCHWDEGYDEDDQPCWWDNEADQEVCPVIWLPADTLPAFPSAPDRRAGE